MNLLQTKLCVPPLTSSVIPRPRLFRKLDTCLEKKLCLLSTPAGYGKTTLVASWAALRKLPLAWVWLDEDDNSFIRIFSYLINAVQNIHPGFGAGILSKIAGPQPIPQRTAVDYLVNELYEIGDDCIIVIDNFHEIQSEEILRLFQRLIENLPPHTHLIIASRTRLPFSVANLRAQRQIVEIDQTELRFSNEEAHLFFKQWQGLALTEKEIAILVENTEGWITALHLAGLSLERHPNTAQFLATLTKENRFISEYLLDEVFSLQPPEIQRFLLETSVCTRFTSAMCDDLLSIRHSSAIISQLERANLYLFPLDNAAEWYRYHKLFAELLYSRLTTETPDLARSLLYRASVWCEKHGLVEDAVEYALRCTDYLRAATLIQSIGNEVLWHGQIPQLLRWLDMLPDGVYHHHAVLRPLGIWALLNEAQFRVAAERLHNVELDNAILAYLPDTERQSYQALMSALRGLIAMNYHLDIATGRQEARNAIENRTANTGLEVMSLLIFGKLSAHSDDLSLAEEYLTQSVRLMRETESPFMIMLALHHLGEFALMHGDLRRAEDLFWEASEHGRNHDLQDTSAFAKIYIDLGRIYYEQNTLETAKHYLLEGIRVAEPYMIAYDVIDGYCTILEIARSQRNFEVALHFTRRIELLGRKCDSPKPLMELAAAAKAKTDLLVGNVRAAQNWLEDNAIVSAQSLEYYQYYEAVTAIEILVALKRLPVAQALCELLLAKVERQHRALCTVRLQSWLASICYQQGEVQKAMQLLLRACEVSVRQGYVRALLDVGNPIMNMLTALPSYCEKRSFPLLDQQLDEYVSKLTNCANVQYADSDTDEQFYPLEDEMFTQRELETLRLLANGFSNQHIAEKMVVSRSTVKYHLANIYTKLDVSTRTEAIAQAMKRHLI